MILNFHDIQLFIAVRMNKIKFARALIKGDEETGLNTTKVDNYDSNSSSQA